MKIDKSFVVNFVAIILIVISYLFDFLYSKELFYIAIFSFSGAITNTIAIHMLFEKVPFFYGSGVIENRFEDFKISINDLIMRQFFTKENLDIFFKNQINSKNIDLSNIIKKTDFTIAFNSLKEAIAESNFGAMLSMLGGDKILEPLKEPFVSKIKSSIIKISQTDSFQKTLQSSLNSDNIGEDIYNKISKIVTKRLDELTPKMVKEMVQQIIKEHLGWLVVWGGVFGGVIGLISSFLV